MRGESRRFCFVDNLYAIGVVLVLMGHSHSSDWSTFQGTILEKIIDFIYTFHMPLFLFIAGFLLMNTSAIEKRGYANWVKDKAMKLLPPYLVLSGVAAVPKYYLENRRMVGFGKHLISALFQPRLTVWGHFWFIPVLFLTYVVFGFLKYKGLLEGKRIVSVLFITGILYMAPIKTLWFGLSDFKTGAVFFVVGASCYVVMDRWGVITRSVRIISAVAAAVVSIVLWNQNLHCSLVNLLIALLMILACYQVAVLIGKNKAAKWISRHNFTLYIYSWPFQAVAMVLCRRMPWYITSSTMFVIGFAAPIVMIVVYEKCQFIQNKFFDAVLGIK